MGFISVTDTELDDLNQMGSMVTAENVTELFDNGGTWGSLITDDDGDPMVVGG